MTEIDVAFDFAPNTQLKVPYDEIVFDSLVALGGLRSLESARKQVVNDENCQTTLLCEGLPFTLMAKDKHFGV